MRDLYHSVQRGNGQLVVCRDKKTRDEILTGVHREARAKGVRIETQKISPTRFYLVGRMRLNLS